MAGETITVSGTQDVIIAALPIKGDIGNTGNTGPRGPTGPQGNPGPSFSGTAWWYGVGLPQTIIGSKPGDYYFDTVSGTVYKLGD